MLSIHFSFKRILGKTGWMMAIATKLYTLFSGFCIAIISMQVNAECSAITDQQIMNVKKPLVELLQIEDSNAQYGYVFNGAPLLIDSLKTGLINLVDKRMSCEKSIEINTQTIQQDLLSVLQLSELNEVSAIYGYDLQILVDKPQNTTGMIFVKLSFGIPCGEDNALLAYRYRNQQWHLDLIWKSLPYKRISGAYSDYFDYLLLGNDNLLIMHTSPDCNLQWESLHFYVVKLGNDKQPQKILFNNTLATHRGVNLVDSKALPDGFKLETYVSMLDTDLSSRKGIYQYLIKNDVVKRVQPIAHSPKDFVDEWLIMNEKDAKNFSVTGNAADLLALRANLEGRNGFYGEQVKFCKKEGLYQLSLTFNGTENNDQNEQYYFYLTPVKKGYLMNSIDIKPKICTE